MRSKKTEGESEFRKIYIKTLSPSVKTCGFATFLPEEGFLYQKNIITINPAYIDQKLARTNCRSYPKNTEDNILDIPENANYNINRGEERVDTSYNRGLRKVHGKGKVQTANVFGGKGEIRKVWSEDAESFKRRKSSISKKVFGGKSLFVKNGNSSLSYFTAKNICICRRELSSDRQIKTKKVSQKMELTTLTLRL